MGSAPASGAVSTAADSEGPIGWRAERGRAYAVAEESQLELAARLRDGTPGLERGLR
jgi:hypothetical protein